jgi:hypothetical protein
MAGITEAELESRIARCISRFLLYRPSGDFGKAIEQRSALKA